MKTPSSLLLVPLLLAARTASAELKSPDRCDAAFLQGVIKQGRGGGVVVNDERVGTSLRDGINVQVLVFGNAKTCDAATWRLLAAGNPLVWRVEAVKARWEKGSAADNAGLLLTAGDFYKDVDAKADAVLAAADEAIAAGVALGVAKQADVSDAQAAWIKANSGGRFGAAKPKLTAVEAGTATVTPESVGPTLRKLLTNTGMSNGGGEAVKKFRLAVLALAAELDKQGRTGAYATARLGPNSNLKDHLGGLPSGFAAPKVDDATAQDDAKFGAALESLVGKGAVAIDAADARAGAALDAVDLGLRNLIAVRAAEIQKIVDAARPRLTDKKTTIAQIEAAARAAGMAGAKAPNNGLAADVMARMAAAPDYLRLDALYENKKDQPGWKESEDGKAVIAARERLQAAALSASVETGADGKKQVVYTQGGRKYVLDGVDPGKIETDQGARGDAATMIARMILGEERGDPKYAALTAAIAGQGQPGVTANPNLTADERSLGADIVLPPVTVSALGPQSCKSPKDLFRNDYERYANRQNAAAAEMAAGNVRSREDVRRTKERQLAEAKVRCDKAKQDAGAIKQDYFEDPAVAQGARTKALADAEAACAKDVADIEAAATAKLKEIETAELDARDPAKVRSRADAFLNESFTNAVKDSLALLRKDYTTAGNRRLRKLAELTGNSTRLTAATGKWFVDTYGPELPTKEEDVAKLNAAAAACAADLGLGPVKDKRSYHNPEDPDNVDKYCKVNEKLTAYVVDQKGRMIKPAQ